MHRSGTSALAGVMTHLGFNTGRRLMPADKSINPKGFWEQEDVVAIHDALLASLGSAWDDGRPLPEKWWETSESAVFRDQLIGVLKSEFGDCEAWTVKDPRLCRLLPLWQGIFPKLNCQPHFLLSVRHPAEVAASLRSRDGLDEAESCLLWSSHLLESERFTRGHPRVIVTYEGLLTDWRQTVTRVSQAFDLDWPVKVGDAGPIIDKFLEPALRRHQGDEGLPDHPACQLAVEIFAQLQWTTPDPNKLDSLAQRYEVMVGDTGWLGRLIEYRRNMMRLQLENVSLRSELVRVKQSVSWQVTKPLRLLENLPRLIRRGKKTE